MIRKLLLGLAALPFMSGLALACDLNTGGSSTVYPFALVVNGAYDEETGVQVCTESTGSGSGIKALLNEEISVANASRAMKPGEWEDSAAAGLTIVEAPIGSDGIVVAGVNASFAVTRQQLLTALTDESITTWSDIDSSLPDVEIVVYFPPTTSGTHIAFRELVFGKISKDLADVSMRADGGVVDAGEDDAVLSQLLVQNPDALGVFGYSFLVENPALKALAIEGVQPTTETIADGSYPTARALYLYVNTADVGAVNYASYFLSDDMAGPDGELVFSDLIPLSDADRESVLTALGN